jgi:predicted secreted hydrolase
MWIFISMPTMKMSMMFMILLVAGTWSVQAQEPAFPHQVFPPARPGYNYVFPRDHGSHNVFRTEWWYFTGHLVANNGSRFGYELTFFRRGMDHPMVRSNPSAWAVRQVYLAHLALTDEVRNRFRMAEKMSRDGLGKAGARSGGLDVWIDRWSAVAMTGHPHRFRLQAAAEDFGIDFLVESRKPPVIHGLEGVSKKGDRPEETSHYYSLTRLDTRGTVRVAGVEYQVDGESWMDHEFGSADLAEGLIGWDWFSVQLANNREVMAYWLRQANGDFASSSSGTIVQEDGTPIFLSREDMHVVVEQYWTSPRSGARYPSRWRLSIPSQQVVLRLAPRMADQELITAGSTGVTYWEGAVEVEGTWEGKPVEGRGYVELTGYAKPYQPGR